MSKRTQIKKTKRRIGRNIIRAWFDTVINPLISALKMEQELLERKNWTWQFRPGHLEAIRDIKELIDLRAVDNLEQFESYYPKIKKNIDVHDEKKAKLLDQCWNLHSVIANSPALQGKYEEATSPAALSKLGKTLDELFGAYPQQDHLHLLAQYIVNNTEFLPDYYITASLWNQYRDDFLEVLNDPAIVNYNRETIATGESLLIVVRNLITSLREERESLSLENDVPYVTPKELIA